jgi:hypothetical protein
MHAYPSKLPAAIRASALALAALCFDAPLAVAQPAAATTRAHLEALTAFGPRPSGSAANQAAAGYLLEELERAGYRVRLHEGVVQSEGRGFQGRVRNVLAWLPASSGDAGPPHAEGGDAGQQPGGSAERARDAVLFAAHYDSVADGPGAGDAAMSVATLLTVAAELPGVARARPVIFLFTDGEERGLLGAQLFVAEDPWAPRVAAVFNFDHNGRQPPLYAFETAPPNGALLGVTARLPGGPRAFSFASDVYRVLPFGTDFTAFERLGVPGLNFAFARDAYAYHTARDLPEAVTPEALGALENTVRGLAEAFVVAGEPLADGRHRTLFFPVGPWLVRVGEAGAAVLGWGGVLAGLATAVLLGWRRRSTFWRGWLTPWLALPLALVLLSGTMALLRALTGRAQVAYAQPWPLLALLMVLAALALPVAEALLLRGRGRAAERLAGALGLWSAGALALLLVAPSSLAFFAVPLWGLAAVAGAELAGAGRAWSGAAAALAVVLAAAVWAEPLVALLPFMVTTLATFGPEPLLFWPLAASALGVVLGSLPWALLRLPAPSGFPARLRRRLAWAGAGMPLAALLALVLLMPAYESERPQRVWAYHVTGEDGAYWALVAPDRVAGTTPGNLRAAPAAELWWVGPRWHREIFPASPAPQEPEVVVHHTAAGLVVEVVPPEAADQVTLFVEGMEVVATEPPRSRFEGPFSLRQAVAGGETARFAVHGKPAAPVRLRVATTTVGLPAEPPFAARLGETIAVSERTLVYVAVPVPEAPVASPSGGPAGPGAAAP